MLVVLAVSQEAVAVVLLAVFLVVVNTRLGTLSSSRSVGCSLLCGQFMVFSGFLLVQEREKTTSSDLGL